MDRVIYTLLILLIPLTTFAGVDVEKTSSEFVECGDMDIVGDITMSAWVNVESFPTSDLAATYRTVMQKEYVSPVEGYYLRIEKLTDQVNCGTFENSDGESSIIWVVDETWNTGEWHHLACTCTDSTKVWELWFDGVIVATSSAQTNCAEDAGSGNFHIGTSEFGGGPEREFDGIISDVAVWDRVLSDEEIQLYYNSKKKRFILQAPTNLLAYYPLDDEEDGTSIASDTFVNMDTPGTFDCTGNSGTAVAEEVLSY